LPVPKADWFSQDLGHRHRYEGEDRAVIETPVTEQLCVPGTRAPRISVLATLADIATGSLVQPFLRPFIPLTVDLDVHRRDLHPVAELVGTAHAVKRGRTVQVTEVTFTDAARPGEVIATSTVRFLRSPEPSDFFEGKKPNYSARRTGIERPFAEQLGAVVVRPGEASIERWHYVLQPTGTIQGGAVALVAELAAESAMGAAVADIDVHYLSQVRAGPAVATATLLWPQAARVEVRDQGNENRLVATATAGGHHPDG
jgi:acyl-coenzyme A thioesterase PaaI-like protein